MIRVLATNMVKIIHPEVHILAMMSRMSIIRIVMTMACLMPIIHTVVMPTSLVTIIHTMVSTIKIVIIRHQSLIIVKTIIQICIITIMRMIMQTIMLRTMPMMNLEIAKVKKHMSMDMKRLTMIGKRRWMSKILFAPSEVVEGGVGYGWT